MHLVNSSLALVRSFERLIKVSKFNKEYLSHFHL